MKLLDKKTLMDRLDNIIPDNFECNCIHVAFHDDIAIIELANRSDIEQKDGDGDA